MPVFKFTSPDGVDYYGEGATQEEAFPTATERSPNEVAAMRTRQSVKPSGGRGESEFTGQLEDFLVPGLGAARDVAAGDYASAAGKAALSAAGPIFGRLPRAAQLAIGAGGAGATTMFTPSAMGEDSKFGFIEDPTERKAAESEYAAIRGYIKDKRTGESQRDPGETARLRQEFMEKKQGEAKTAADKRREERSQADALKNFEAHNEEAIKALTPDQRNQYDARVVPGNIPATIMNKSEYLSRVAAERENATKGFAQRHPELMEDIQRGSYAASAAIPIASLYSRAASLSKAAKAAEKAYLDAVTSPKSNKALEGVSKLRANQLEEVAGSKGLPWSTVALAPTIPFAAAEAPNLIDLATLQNHPEAEAYKHAWKMVNPWASDEEWYNSEAFQTMVRALSEGAEATAAGLGAGEPLALLREGRAGRSAKGTLRTIRDREAEMKEAEEYAKATRAATANEKKAEKERQRAGEVERALADERKKVFAEQEAKREEQRLAEEAERKAQEEEERKLHQRKIRAIKDLAKKKVQQVAPPPAEKLSQNSDPLAPGNLYDLFA